MSKYKLVAKPVANRNVFKVTIEADSNDGDYISQSTTYTQSEFDDIVDALKDLRDNYGGHHQLENYPNHYDLDIPYNGYDGYCHTLESLDIEFTDEHGVTWQVDLL